MSTPLIHTTEPVRVLQSPGADLDALRQFCYTPSCVAPPDHCLQDSEGCQCLNSCHAVPPVAGQVAGGQAAAAAVTAAAAAVVTAAVGPAADGDAAASSGSHMSCGCYMECSRGLQALKAQGRASGLVLLLECGPACACSSSCPARPTQQGVTVGLELFWSDCKGWCVRTLESIAQGVFVCEYAGQYVSGREADARLAGYDTQERGHALLVVRVQLPSRTSALKCCIDATRRGNVARFINHSCDGGNLEPVIVSSRGSILPRVALFAARHIAEGEELSFSYACTASSRAVAAATSGVEGLAAPGGGAAAASSSLRRCFCGTAACSGYLPTATC